MTIQTAIKTLGASFGEKLSVAEAVRAHHGEDGSYYPALLPDAVLFPESAEEVAEIVKICAAEGCPIIPWGVGTSLEGHTLPFHGGVTLDMSKMDRVVEVLQEDMLAVVQPGVTREALNEWIRDTGLFFPVDPGANATLGGMAATRASGTNAVRYGTMRDNVLAAQAVLADGRIVRVGSRAKKTSAGYDLKNLLVGSEGTLGIFTELTVKLYGVPESITAATCAFDDVEGAVNAVIMAIQMGIPMARIEFLDEFTIAAVNNYSKLGLPEKPHLFLEFHGTEAGAAEQAEMFGEIASDFGAGGFEWTSNAEERNRLWKARHNVYFASLSMKPGAKPLSTDVCVPISRLAEALLEARRDVDESPLMGGIAGHVGDGNFHVGLLLDPQRPEDLEEAKRLCAKWNADAIRMGGTITGEHGVGRGKRAWMADEHGDGYAVMAELKRALDPRNILNPGKVVELN
ncbi:MAG: FAD-linked oxidase C-terminal domain-containing protein [Pseudomonadota bacterium]